MSFELVADSYGKSAIRLVRVTRSGQQHDVKDISVDIQFEGDFDAVHTKGDNSKVLPTDTMKNTVYVLAAQHAIEEIEDLGVRLVAHFLANNEQVTAVKVRISEHRWSRISAEGKPHPTAFLASSGERRIATLIGTREQTTVSAGIDGLLILRTAGSAFDGYIKDAYTTLPETRDRIFATTLKADWDYHGEQPSFGLCWRTVREALLETFANHPSESVQHTLHAMAEAALESCAQLGEIRLSMPNKHHLIFNLSRFGMENQNEVFIPTDEPYGLIQATLRRT